MPKKLTALTAATALADADQFLLEQGGASKRISTLTAAATASSKGFAELATQAEVDAGTDAERIVTPDTLLGSPSSAFLRLFHAQEQKASGTNSATSLNITSTPSAVARRDLVEVIDTLGVDGSGGGSVGGTNNTQITLPAGTYELDVVALVAPEHVVSDDTFYHRLEWYNTSDSASVIHGSTMLIRVAASNDRTSGMARLRGKFTIAASKTFELRHWGVTAGANLNAVLGGEARSGGLGGFGEIYADIVLRQLAVG